MKRQHHQYQVCPSSMLQAFQKFRYGFHSTPDDIVKYVLAHFNPINFCQKVNCIFKANLFSFSLESLLSFESTRCKSHNPPKSSNFLSNLSLPSASIFSFFSLCSMLSFNCLFFLPKISLLFLKNEALCLLLEFGANSRTLCISSGVNLFLHWFVLIYIGCCLHISDPGLLALASSSLASSLSDSTLVVANFFI